MQEFFIPCDGIRLRTKLVIVPGYTHCFDYNPEMMTDAVKDFLAGVG